MDKPRDRQLPDNRLDPTAGTPRQGELAEPPQIPIEPLPEGEAAEPEQGGQE